MLSVIPHFWQWYVDGNYDRLFSYYANFTEEDWDRIACRVAQRAALRSGLVTLFRHGRHRPFWAVLRPLSNRSGEVVRSNFLPVGARVRSKTQLRHAARTIRPGQPDTLGDPRALDIQRDKRDSVMCGVRFTLAPERRAA